MFPLKARQDTHKKSAVEHAQNMKIQIILHMGKVSSQIAFFIILQRAVIGTSR